jgi:hypothetical protein
MRFSLSSVDDADALRVDDGTGEGTTRRKRSHSRVGFRVIARAESGENATTERR